MSGASEPGNGHPAESASRRAYVESGLALMGLEASPEEIAVIEVVDAVYAPGLQALLAEGFDGVPHEPSDDMSRPPRAAPER